MKHLFGATLIQRINRVEIKNVEDFKRLAGKFKKGDPIVLHTIRYNRRGQTTVPRIIQFTVN